MITRNRKLDKRYRLVRKFLTAKSFWKTNGGYILMAIFTGFLIGAILYFSLNPVSRPRYSAPRALGTMIEVKTVIAQEEDKNETERDRIFRLIQKASVMFFPEKLEKQAEITLHCLIKNESRYNTNKGHGDGGLAGGPMQFHDGTYIRIRKQMMMRGYVNVIGSRYNLDDAIYTTAYALSEGRGREWGPILRGECDNVTNTR